MAGFAGNMVFKVSCQLPFRFFSISRSIWKSPIACLKCRDFSSSLSVRYIASTFHGVKLSETALPVKSRGYCSFLDVNVLKINGGKDVHATIAHCEISQDANEICSDFFFDDSEQGSFDQIEEVAELTIHQGGDSGDQDLIQVDKIISDVEESAVKLLAARALTALELRKKLLGKRFSPNSVDAVINKFQRRGLINDRLYAESFSQSRWSSSSWGPRRIKQALFKKGVSQADAEKAVEVVFKSNDCAEDHKSVIGLSKHSLDHLYTQVSKQWFRGPNVPKETRKSRIVRWLQYRGFDWNVINLMLKKLDRQDQNSP
ncbi:regulatory protein RecX [Vigna umbellata]|uniref:regulatory protein RecX n=1 Tax=Vigna umbellata TaxID=87088 RepID=UPI001F5F0F05|nr:regulatory protein RecX [Vigna umbellata]